MFGGLVDGMDGVMRQTDNRMRIDRHAVVQIDGVTEYQTVLDGVVGRYTDRWTNRTDQEAHMRTERQEGASTDGWTY